MGRGDSLDAHLCGLALLLELLQLLGSEEAHGLVASYELGARWHGGEDDVAAQPTEAVDGKQDRALAPARIRPHTKGNQGVPGPVKIPAFWTEVETSG